MILVALFLATCFLAYSNGANDNFKGVASLYGCRAANYRTAISWATITTFAGSIASIFLAQALLKKFSGKGLVPDTLRRLGAVPSRGRYRRRHHGDSGHAPRLSRFRRLTALPARSSAAAWSRSAPALIFARSVKDSFSRFCLARSWLLVLGGLIYFIFRALRLVCGVRKEWCICVGMRREGHCPPPACFLPFDAQRPPAVTLAIDEQENCRERYAGSMLGLSAQQIMDGAHFLSAGVVSFARGLNDTPKIVAMLLLLQWMDIRWGFFAVAVTMAVGGLLNARRVAETMSHKITAMNHGQGFSANLTTGLLVIAGQFFRVAGLDHACLRAAPFLAWA